MRLMIASDVHGSSFYCKELLEAFERENADKLLLLGDLLYHGPRNDLPKEHNPKACIAMLNSVKDKLLCVRGNCEAEVDQMVLEFPVMADYCILYLDDIMLFSTHGHSFNEKNVPPFTDGTILLNGHTHIPACVEHENYIYMNPGSVSIPKNGSTHSYMVYENGVFEWKNLEGEVYNTFKLTPSCNL
ncbi:MAG: phosphodiesterase [Lachnospiraceae bacterium]|nr:phosphodiesterase [Lachnospiraceae bacterium]